MGIIISFSRNKVLTSNKMIGLKYLVLALVAISATQANLIWKIGVTTATCDDCVCQIHLELSECRYVTQWEIVAVHLNWIMLLRMTSLKVELMNSQTIVF